MPVQLYAGCDNTASSPGKHVIEVFRQVLSERNRFTWDASFLLSDIVGKRLSGAGLLLLSLELTGVPSWRRSPRALTNLPTRCLR